MERQPNKAVLVSPNGEALGLQINVKGSVTFSYVLI